MQIDKIEANNFKSLVDFKLDLTKFNCLIGLNGSGKSTVLQFIDFLAQQVRGDIKGWLSERKWLAKEIRSQFSKKNNIDFFVSLSTDAGEQFSWEASFNPRTLNCTTESIKAANAALDVRAGRFSVSDPTRNDYVSSEQPIERVSFKYQGSILSQLKESTLPAPLIEFKRFFEGVESLDTLTPERLRQRTRSADGSLGHGGRNLSAFLYELGPSRRKELTKSLREAYPELSQISAKSLRSGWKQFEAIENYEGHTIRTEARHLNDGMLRLMAILAELQSDHSFMLFDEIENGINPELVEILLESLTSAKKQVLVTTHSPMILNYLSDDIAKLGVIYLYKTPQGVTQAIPFFSIPSLAEKLTVMGPGEVFVDTNLIALSEEIQAVTEGQ